ncbi:MAG TPA: thiolase family protein [Ktedonobacterales bacterium]|jgi:acetyl-CoA acetyltransferase family protein
MPDAYILDAVRTPFGRGKAATPEKPGGTLSATHPQDLAAAVLRGLVERTGIEPTAVEDVILGCVTAVNDQAFDIARVAALMALGEEVPGVQLNRFCSSALQAINFAAQAVMAGAQDLVIGGGVESMSRVPMMADHPTFSPNIPFEVWTQYDSAEAIANHWELTREALDDYSARSHQLAANARDAGFFAREIVPVRTDGREVATDEGIRADTTPERLAMLAPLRPGGKIHAGNSSQLTDGAAAALVATLDVARKRGIRPRARVVSMAVTAGDPTAMMLTGPIPSTRKALARVGLGVDDIDVFEINEAFAPVPLVVAHELGVPLEKVNVNGGAIALGHPIGASGARLIATLINELERRDARRGVATLCVGLGMGVATVIERDVHCR